MTGVDVRTTSLPLPGSAWAMGWAFLGAAVLGLLRDGVSDAGAGSILISMVLSALLVRWFAAGVLSAAPVRVAIVWLLVGLVLLLEAIAAIVHPGDPGHWIDVLETGVPAVLLARFCAGGYYAERRRLRGDAHVLRPALGGILLLAVATGAVGGLVDHGDGPGVHVHVGL